MERVTIEDGASIECIDCGAYSFNGDPFSISYCSVAIGETVVRLEGGVIREHVL